MQRVIVLGNCVAERLALLLDRACSVLGAEWHVVHARPVFLIHDKPDELDALAAQARQCHLVLSQPLFSFGACNTATLASQVRAAGQRYLTFSAPNFEAYFPDVLSIPFADGRQVFSPPLEWHSRIIAQCFASSMPEEEAARIYPMHPLFHEKAVARAIEQSLARYEKREQGVDIGSLALVREHYAREPLFHTWNHPAERILLALLDGMLEAMGVSTAERRQGRDAVIDQSWEAEWSFGFNRWPIITRQHALFAFDGREKFRVAGQDSSIEDVVIAYYNYYRFHPKTFAAVLDRLR